MTSIKESKDIETMGSVKTYEMNIPLPKKGKSLASKIMSEHLQHTDLDDGDIEMSE